MHLIYFYIAVEIVGKLHHQTTLANAGTPVKKVDRRTVHRITTFFLNVVSNEV